MTGALRQQISEEPGDWEQHYIVQTNLTNIEHSINDPYIWSIYIYVYIIYKRNIFSGINNYIALNFEVLHLTTIESSPISMSGRPNFLQTRVSPKIKWLEKITQPVYSSFRCGKGRNKRNVCRSYPRPSFTLSHTPMPQVPCTHRVSRGPLESQWLTKPWPAELWACHEAALSFLLSQLVWLRCFDCTAGIYISSKHAKERSPATFSLWAK